MFNKVSTRFLSGMSGLTSITSPNSSNSNWLSSLTGCQLIPLFVPELGLPDWAKLVQSSIKERKYRSSLLPGRNSGVTSLFQR